MGWKTEDINVCFFFVFLLFWLTSKQQRWDADIHAVPDPMKSWRLKKEEEEDSEVRLMKEYRAQLDAERARKLARGINHAAKSLSSKGW